MFKKLLLSSIIAAGLLIPASPAHAGRFIYRNGYGGRWARPYYGQGVYRYRPYPAPYVRGYYYAPNAYYQPYGAYYAAPYAGGYYVNGGYLAPNVWMY